MIDSVELGHLLAQLRQQGDELNAIPEVRAAAEIVADLEERLRLAREFLNNTEPDRRIKIAALRTRILCKAEATGHGAKGSGYEVAYRRGYTRGSWDSKGLQGYAKHDPTIMEFYSESEVAPSISIKDLT